MTRILTPNFKTHMATQFFESLTEPANTVYYAFSGKASIPFDNEASPPTPNNSYSDVLFDNFNEMVFAKKIDPADVVYTVRRIIWESGTVYDFYDDRRDNLSSSNYYVASLESEDYHIFKCLDNNGGIPSTDQPLFSETNDSETFYQTADGYIWRYMYSITAFQWLQFSSNCGMPVYTNANVVNSAIPGTIEKINVETPGLNYNAYANGIFTTIASGGDPTKFIISSADFTLSTNTNFYASSQIYLKEGTGSGQIRSVVGYNGTTKTITIDNAFSLLPDGSTIWEIGPKVTINGDGSNASAIVNINPTGNSIANVQMINVGSNYTRADVILTSNSGVSTDSLVQANLRAIISPKDGHGANAAGEFFADKLTIAFLYANTEANTIPTNNVIRTVGILKDPMFANVVITYEQDGGVPAAGDWTIGETIIQNTTNARGTLAAASGATLTINNITGFFETGNTTYKYITGQTSNTSAAVSTLDRSFTTIDQRTAIEFTYVFTGSDGQGFDINERVYQGTNALPTAFGYVHSVSANTIYLTEMVGTFSTNSVVTGANSKAIATISTPSVPPLVPDVGEILYVENFTPIERLDTQSEEFKIVIEF